jgi:hypothetical protein
MFIYGLVVEAIINQAAPLAQRILWTANLSTVTNHVDVNFIEAPSGNHRGHQTMRLLVGALFGNQPEPSSYAKYVSVYWKDGAVACEQ